MNDIFLRRLTGDNKLDSSIENDSGPESFVDFNGNKDEERCVSCDGSTSARDVGVLSPHPQSMGALEEDAREDRWIIETSALSSPTGAATPDSTFTPRDNHSTTSTTPLGEGHRDVNGQEQENPDHERKIPRARITGGDRERFTARVILSPDQDPPKGWMKASIDTQSEENVISKQIVDDYQLVMRRCPDDQLPLMPLHLRTESPNMILPLGVVELEFYFQDEPRTLVERFLVVDTVYDCIIGRKTILKHGLLTLNGDSRRNRRYHSVSGQRRSSHLGVGNDS